MVERHDRLDVAAVNMSLAGVPHVDDLAADAEGLLPTPVARNDRAVQDHVRKPLGPGPFQRRAQVRGLVGQHCDDLVQVAVGGGPRDAVAAGQRIRSGAVAEPAQSQDGLPEAGQRPAAPRGAAPPALGMQQLRGELDQFPWDVKRGTMDDHVEPSGGSRSCGETSSTGAPRPFPGRPVRPRVYPRLRAE